MLNRFLAFTCNSFEKKYNEKIDEDDIKDYIITGAANETYVWDDEDTLTAKEVSEMMAAREIKLATIKKNRDDYKATKNSAIKTVATGDYNF